MKEYCVILLEAPGRTHVMQSKKVPDLETVHNLIDCDIVETVNLNDDYIMLVDEEGRLKEGRLSTFSLRSFTQAIPTLLPGTL